MYSAVSPLLDVEVVLPFDALTGSVCAKSPSKEVV